MTDPFALFDEWLAEARASEVNDPEAMRTDAQQGIILNIVVGIVGAVIAGLLFGQNINAGITIESFLYSLIGAVILLAIVNLIRRGSVR